MKHYLRFLITMLLLAIWGGISYGQGQETVVKTLSFPPDNEKESQVNSYEGTKTYTIGSDSWSVTGFNNNNWGFTNNGHKIIKCGRKDNTSVASIVTREAYSEQITKVVVTLDSYGQSYLKDAVLTVSSDKNFSSVIETVRLTPAQLKKGDVAFEIPNPTKDSFYKLTFNCVNCKKNGQTAWVSKVQYFAAETRTATNVTFGVGVDGNTYDVNEGEGDSFVGKTATEKDNVAGSIRYTSDKPEIVAVNESTGALTFGASFGKATITALFTPTDATTYAESSASYIIDYKEKTRIATTLAFAETEGSVNLGESFTLPGLTLKAGDEILTGKTYKYTSSAPEVASIDENTGEVKILSAGNTVLTAVFTGADDVYKSSSATFTLKVVDPNAIVFSVADGSFKNVVSYDVTEKNPDVVFVSASGKNYTFNLTLCTKGTQANSGCLQMKSGKGIVKSPSFDAFPNGYKVTVYYTIGENPENLTIKSAELPDAKSTTVKTGDDYVTTISLPLYNAKFIMTANSGVKYISKIELTPLAAPATVTLDETSDNISTVISDNADKTVNVTLKRTISKDYLNPVCLPFDLSADKIAEVFGAGSVVSDYTSVEGTVMNFTPVNTMTANHPYIVQATESFDTKNIAGVTLKTYENKENSVEFENTNHTFLGTFIGSPSIVVFSKDVEMKLFLGKDGNLYHPTSGSKMKGMRAYFDVTDLTSSEAKVNIGGSLSSIGKLMNGEAITGKVYNLNGQYVGNTLDGLAKGLYIMNGKKYVVK